MRKDWPGTQPNAEQLHGAEQMHAKHVRHRIQTALLHHQPRAVAALFGGLEEQHDSTMQFGARQHVGHGE